MRTESVAGSLAGIASKTLSQATLNFEHSRRCIRLGRDDAGQPFGRKGRDADDLEQKGRDTGHGASHRPDDIGQFASITLPDELERQMHLLGRNFS